MENLAGLALAYGRNDEAEPQFARALAIKERAFGNQSPELLGTLDSYALVLSYLERPAEAAALRARAAAIRQRLDQSGMP